MRRAKQAKADQVSARAERMATDRADALVNDTNAKTDFSLTKAVEVNREQMRNLAMERSVLGRAGKFAVKNATRDDDPRSIEFNVSTSSSAHQVHAPRDFTGTDRSIVEKRRHQPFANHGADSLAPSQRKALEQGYNVQQLPQRNISQPQNQVNQRPPINQGRVAIQNTQGQQVVRNDFNQGVNVQPRTLTAHGITQNPVEDARRRRRLEAKIRELANK